MNARHLEGCSSEEWAGVVREHIIPWVLDGTELGRDVLELGPGPGRTTEVLAELTERLVAVEIDRDLSRSLGARLAGSGVRVVRGDGVRLPFGDESFETALSFTMLHHVPSPALQDLLLREMARVLRAGGRLAGVDSLDSPEFRELHEEDTCVPIDPATFWGRLIAAGFEDATVETNPYAVRFWAVKRR